MPVVVHGADRIWPKGFTFHKGELPIEVLPPIDTSGWTAETSKEHAQAVHDLVVAVLCSSGARPRASAEHRGGALTRPSGAPTGADADTLEPVCVVTIVFDIRARCSKTRRVC